MKITSIFFPAAIIILASALAAPAGAGPLQAPPAGLSEVHRTWLESDVVWIITPAEREAFLKLGSEEDRGRFIEEFWLQRDPTPGTADNEYRSEHFRRLAFADKAFGKKTGRDGRTTPRGRVYVRFGMPLAVDRTDAAGLRPLEMWTYLDNPAAGRGGTFRILFYKPAGSREYEIYDPGRDKPSRLAPSPGQAASEAGAPFAGDPSWPPPDQAAFRRLAAAAGPLAAECVLTCWPGDRGPEAARRSSAVLAGRAEAAPRRVDDGWADRWRQGRALPAVGYSVQPLSIRATLEAFDEPDGSRVIHVAAAPERISFERLGPSFLANIRTTITLLDGDGRAVFERSRETILALDREEMAAIGGKPVRFYEALPIGKAAGVTAVHWRLENLVDKTFAVAESRLAAAVGPGLAAETAAVDAGTGRRAFRIGRIQIDPEPDGAFAANEAVWLFVQAGGGSPAAGDAGLIEAVLRGGGGTADPRTIRAPLAEAPDGNVLVKLPVEGLPPGDYAVEIRRLDGAGKTASSRGIALHLRDGGAPDRWIIASALPPAQDPAYAYLLGRTAGGKDGSELLARAWREREDSAEFAVGYAEALLAAGDFRPARDVLRRYDDKPGAGFALYAALAKAAAGAGQMKEAAQAWEKALLRRRNDPAALNALGDCRLAAGDAVAARAAWTRSLDIDPGQPEVKRKMDALR